MQTGILVMIISRMLKKGTGVAGTIPVLARSLDHPSHPLNRVIVRCGLVWGKARLGAPGLGG